MSENVSIRRGATEEKDPRKAVAELAAQLALPHTAAVFFFCSPEHDQLALAAALQEAFGKTPLAGATTAGEIGPLGYREGSISGFSLSADVFETAMIRFDGISGFSVSDARQAIARLKADDRFAKGPVGPANSFGFLLVDGLSMREELVTSTIYGALDGIPLVGGSAGDALHFERTFVYHEGVFHRDAAVFSLIRTDLPFSQFQIQHFKELDVRLVVTAADPERRIVRELNGVSAAKEYAALAGVREDQLGPAVFADHPVVVKIGGRAFVRSIQKVDDAGNLHFYCAIEEGLVLRLAKGGDILANLQEQYDEIARRIGPPQLAIGCDCILRSIELDNKKLKAEIGEWMNQRNFAGFCTYGEQFNGVHSNQTLTGIAIGRL